MKGTGVEQSYEKALRLLELSSKQGCSEALYELGRIYEEGIGVNRSIRLAKNYYNKSMKMRNSDAEERLRTIEGIDDE